MLFAGGAPDLLALIASIFALISELLKARPPSLLEIVDASGRGCLAAVSVPSGVDEWVMFVVVADSDIDRTAGRGDPAAVEGGREGASLGDGSGDGESRGRSLSYSSPGLDAMTGARRGSGLARS